MTTPILVTGDDVALSVTLKKDAATFDIPIASPMVSVVKAAIVNQNRDTVLLASVTQDSTATGANWAASLVVVEFTSAQTAAITFQGGALLEIEVEDAGEKTTWFGAIDIKTGSI